MSLFATQRFPLYLARFTALVLAFGTCQLAAAGIATDRARLGHVGRSAGNRLSASRSGAPGCELALRDGSPPGETLTSRRDDSPSSPRSSDLFLVAAAATLPSWNTGIPLAGTTPTESIAPFSSACHGRGPPRR